MSYDQSASVYDAMYEARKDYAAEAQRLHELIKSSKKTSGNRLLDVACGTGLHDQHLVQWYDVEGIDLSEGQLAIARKRLPDMTFYQANMTTFDLGQQYDVVTCLFSSIGHMTTMQKLKLAVANMAKHVKPGGLLVIEPWLHPDDFRPGNIGSDFVDEPELKVARITIGKRQGRISALEMHHLVGRPGKVDYFVEHHKLGLYTAEEYLSALSGAGLSAWHDKQGLMGRGLFLGLKHS